MRIEEFFKKYARGRGVKLAERAASRIRAKLSRRTPLSPAPAIPFAPPRLRTSRLRSSVKVIRTAHGARLVVWALYGPALEYGKKRKGFPHQFIKPSFKELGIE